MRTTSSTENGNVTALCCVSTARRRASSAGLHAARGRPPSSTAPAAGARSPVSTWSSVDLPAPLGRPAPRPRRPGPRGRRPRAPLVRRAARRCPWRPPAGRPRRPGRERSAALPREPSTTWPSGPPALAGPRAAQLPEEERAARPARSARRAGSRRAPPPCGRPGPRPRGSPRPPRTDAGSSMRWPGPAIIRTRCGITRPTNRMIPDTATAAAVSTAVTTSIFTRKRSTGSPRWRAGRSPSASRSSWPRCGGRRRSPARRGAPRPRPSSRSPAPCCRGSRTSGSAARRRSEKYVSSPITAPSSALSATPVRTSVTTSVRPSARAAPYTSEHRHQAAHERGGGELQVPSGSNPRTIWATAPSTAPDDTPTIPGSASGFANVPCIMAPAHPSEPPTSAVRATRGKRISHSTSSASWSGARPPWRPRWRARVPSTSSAGME